MRSCARDNSEVMKKFLLMCAAVLCALPAGAEDADLKKQSRIQVNPISSDEYYKKAVKINEIRKKHILGADTLLNLMKDKNTVLLDVRGDDSFRQKHIRGAVHLSLADMTPQTLAKAIPSKGSRVILYCDAALIPYPTRMIGASTQAYPLVFQHGYGNLYEVGELWRPDWFSVPRKDAAGMRREYTNYLKIPFEGDTKVIERGKKSVEQALQDVNNAK